MIDKRYESGIGYDVIYKFRLEDKFADLILTSWGIVEGEIDTDLRLVFGISHDDPKNDLVLHHAFRRKVEFLQKMKVFSKEEGKSLLKFEKERNDMFHKLFKGLIFDIQNPDARSNMMDSAIIAVQVCIVAGGRVRSPNSVIGDNQPNPFVVWKRKTDELELIVETENP
jgi:hypothetical protein